MARSFFTRKQQQALRLSAVEVSKISRRNPDTGQWDKEGWAVSLRQLGTNPRLAQGIGIFDTPEEAEVARKAAHDALYLAHQWEATE